MDGEQLAVSITFNPGGVDLFAEGPDGFRVLALSWEQLRQMAVLKGVPVPSEAVRAKLEDMAPASDVTTQEG